MVMILIIVTVVIDVTEKIDDFRNAKLGVKQIIFEYYVYFVPFIVNLLTPICIFLSVIFFTARLANDTEIVAMLSAGISLYRLFLPYLWTSMLISGLSFYLNAYIVPYATVKRMDFEYAYIKNKFIYAERDIHKKIAPDLYFYASSFNQFENTAYQFSLERIENNLLQSKLLASRGVYVDSTKKWRLENVKIRNLYYEAGPSRAFREEVIHKTIVDTALLLSPSDIYKRENFLYGMTLTELNEYIALESLRGSDFLPELLVNRMERFAFPFAGIILTLIGFSLSTAKKRGGIALSLGIGIVLAFIFIILVQLGKTLAGAFLDPLIGLWLPNIIFLIIGLILLRVAPK